MLAKPQAEQSVCPHAVVALSGGTGSALVAYLVASVFEDAAVACIGRSPSLPTAHLDRARYTADALGEAPLAGNGVFVSIALGKTRQHWRLPPAALQSSGRCRMQPAWLGCC